MQFLLIIVTRCGISICQTTKHCGDLDDIFKKGVSFLPVFLYEQGAKLLGRISFSLAPCEVFWACKASDYRGIWEGGSPPSQGLSRTWGTRGPRGWSRTWKGGQTAPPPPCRGAGHPLPPLPRTPFVEPCDPLTARGVSRTPQESL